ncbi:MAG TPA: maleylpyruvate isomerase family mycothiol-dependent enzyme [Dermatophilaceae bacterium]|jgi:maleylpyruvate isomerase|nr:maleylpyruvate isomerase family mycothiol-dependent enzyme [Dermatophilaceae bacterium]
MTATSHLSDNLTLLDHETSLLVRTAATLDDATIRAASRCEGWTRAHVLSHIARNADGLANLVSWAVTGTPVAMYESPQARDEDIAAGSTRSAQEILNDLTESAARFAAAATGLAGPPERSEVEMRTGRRVLGGQLPTLRLLEVVFHHVDLDAGYTFADADPGFVRRAIRNAVERMKASGNAPAISLRGDNGDTWSVGEGAQEVTGTNAALLLWLARSDGAGVSGKDALPELPAWG